MESVRSAKAKTSRWTSIVLVVDITAMDMVLKCMCAKRAIGRPVFSMMKQVSCNFLALRNFNITGTAGITECDLHSHLNSDGSPYYYETRNWTFSSLLPSFTRAEPEKPKFEGTPITDSERETYTKMKKLAPPEAVRSMMMVKGIRKKDIDKLLNN